MQQTQPNNQQDPIENKIPQGTATTAFAASSDICTEVHVVRETHTIVHMAGLRTRRIESANRPDWRQPRKHERPTSWPGCEVFRMRENVGSAIAILLPNRECYDGCEDEDKIQHNED